MSASRSKQGLLAALLAGALLCGAALRLSFVQDMEYKEDEEINFTQSQLINESGQLPWAGMPSGVFLPNPGMSVWVFAGLAKLSGARTPTELAHVVELWSLFGILLILPFAFGWIRSKKERELWLWAFALAMVNPFLILYQRKLWPEPILPAFCMVFLMCWWRREKPLAALLWGALGPILGQIHMSGFFVAGGFAFWTWLEDRARPAWRYWTLGSLLGALPLIPWLLIALKAPRGGSIGAASEPLQLKYWAFWLTDSLGLHLGNPLGLHRGGVLAQIEDFNRYPIIGGHETYAVAAAHALLALAGGAIFMAAALRALRSRDFQKKGDTSLAVRAALFGAGLLLTATFVNIRRYYLCATFPLELVFLCGLAFYGLSATWARRALALLWVAQLVVSASFVHYVHVNEGALQGDYGDAYHVVLRKRQLAQ